MTDEAAWFRVGIMGCVTVLLAARKGSSLDEAFAVESLVQVYRQVISKPPWHWQLPRQCRPPQQDPHHKKGSSILLSVASSRIIHPFEQRENYYLGTVHKGSINLPLGQYHFVSVITIRDEDLMFDGKLLSDMYEIGRRESVASSVADDFERGRQICRHRLDSLGQIIPAFSSTSEEHYAFRSLDPTQAIDIFTSLSWRPFMAMQPPTLSEILLGVTSPPWTLAAFEAYLFQNHCIETIQFTLDSRRYAAFYDQFVAERPASRESRDRVCGSWELLMQTYITPCAPREVNLSSRVRDRLLSIPCGPSPPPPPELEDAIRSIFELMNESLLVPFLQSVGPS
ncbi:hypothetical protein PCL_12083 [Purpureocillium lilacinum]|uniref:RGS domain-containing protein n=1 Tax=Purpureocillium lilacinum TaxID=33203 RepID=A0A2U3DPI6_PURLI|nr:hypothetical protein PCL_12083 [Purpureocillium lilacinum]